MKPRDLEQDERYRQQYLAQTKALCQAPWRHQHIEKDDDEDKEFHGAGPLHERSAATRIFKPLRAVDHSEFELA